MSRSLLHSKRAKAYAFLLVNTVLWGFAPPIIKNSLEFISINQFLFWRYLLASLIFLPVYLFTFKKKSLDLGNWKLLILLALLGTPLTLIPLYEGIKLTTSIESSILTATGPVLVILGGIVFLREKVARNEKFGLITALIGTLLLTLEPLLVNNHDFKFSFVGNLFILSSNLIWTAFLLLVKKLKINTDQISLISYFVSIPVFALLVFTEGSTLYPFSFSLYTSSLPALLGVAYMAIFGSVIAFWAYTKGQELIEASEASIFTYLQPLFTFPLAYFWLHEPITNVTVVASLLIVFGVYLSEYRHVS